jgi:hypothetical protein
MTYISIHVLIFLINLASFILFMISYTLICSLILTNSIGEEFYQLAIFFNIMIRKKIFKISLGFKNTINIFEPLK